MEDVKKLLNLTFSFLSMHKAELLHRDSGVTLLKGLFSLTGALVSANPEKKSFEDKLCPQTAESVEKRVH